MIKFSWGRMWGAGRAKGGGGLICVRLCGLLWGLVSLGFALLALAPWVAQAATIHVPADQPSIHAGVGAAHDGDEVVVSPGIYHEGLIHFGGKNITLRSTFTGDWSVVRNTIIDGGIDGGTIIWFDGTESTACTLRGLTLTRLNVPLGTNVGAGIVGNYCNATIEYNIISNNYMVQTNPRSNYAYQGGGIARCNGLIQNNIIKNNVVNQGGGLYGCNGTIQNNLITGNYITANVYYHDREGTVSVDAEGDALHSCNGIIRNNTIVNNGRDIQGATLAGGMYACTGSILNNIFWVDSSKAIETRECSAPNNCLIKGYTGPGEGNISGDPKFVDPANGDFRLRPDSPCIDAGKRLPDVKADFDGHQRGLKTGVQAQGDGSGADIGAFEALPKPVALWLPDGGPAHVLAGDSLKLALQLDAEAGTALSLKLMHNGSPVADLGQVSAPGGAAEAQVQLPAALLVPADYTIQGTSQANAAFVSSTASFTIEHPLQNAVPLDHWRLYDAEEAGALTDSNKVQSR